MEASISSQLIEINKKILEAQQPDQNWFYSTMAQSSAAIVGLLGAILISKIIDHSNSLKEEKLELESGLRGWKGFVDPNLQGLESDFRSDAERQKKAKNLNNLIRAADFDKIEEVKKVSDALTSLLDYLGEVDNNPNFRKLKNENKPEIDRILKRYRLYNSRLLPRSFNIIFGILFFLLVLGVLLPMVFLSGLNWWFFLALTTIAVFIGAWFYYQLTQLKISNQIRVNDR